LTGLAGQRQAAQRQPAYVVLRVGVLGPVEQFTGVGDRFAEVARRCRGLA